MKKEFLLLVLTVCLIFCLNLSSCDEDFKTESVPGLWEKLRNTAWTMEKTIKEDGVNKKITYTVGFYGPQNGPKPKMDPDHGSLDDGFPAIVDKWKYPYFVVYITTNEGGNCFSELSHLKINRTGDKISTAYSDAYIKYWASVVGDAPQSSFNVSVSDNSLTISNVNTFFLSFSSTSNDDDFWKWWSYLNQINGTYTKISSDPHYPYYPWY
jgi:hypothetical protein